MQFRCTFPSLGCKNSCATITLNQISFFVMAESNKSLFLRFALFHCLAYCFSMIFLDKFENQSSVETEDYVNTHFAKDIDYHLINKSKKGDTKFVNTKLNARNVLEIPISNKTTNSLEDYYRKYVEPFLTPKKCSGRVQGIKGHEFFCVSPPTWNSDIKWISVNSQSSYDSLLPYFEDMDLTNVFKNIIDVDSKIVIYSIFFVVRSKIESHTLHVDFQPGTNVNGFTLLTPLQDKNDVHLFYIDKENKKRRYRYKRGVGVVFGENFIHSTDVRIDGGSREVVFCFSFGTDKMTDWEIIKQTAANQGLYFMHPKNGFTKEGR